MTIAPASGQGYDVVIVGGRVAGCALAARLATAGLTVAVFDRDNLPAPTLSTHILHGTADLRIEGVYDELVAAGVPPLHEVRIRLDDIAISLTHTDDPGMCTRRETLDHVLLGRALTAGAKIFPDTAVVGLTRAGDRVTGVVTQAPDGSTTEVTARLVVGADGRNSSVARWAGSRQYLASRSERALVWRYFRGRPLPPVLTWHRIGEHIVSALPTGPDEFLLIAQPPDRLQSGISGTDPGSLTRHVAAISPEIGDLVAGAEPVGPLRRMVRYPCFFRQPYGPGWALVGDAGHAKDATLGQGINDALRNTRALASALLPAWDRPADVASALRRWAMERDGSEMPNYWYGQDLGRAVPITPMEHAILLGIQRSAKATRALDDVMGDRMAADKLLTPGRLVAGIGRQLAAGTPPRPVLAEASRLIRLDLRRRRAVAQRAATAPPMPGRESGGISMPDQH